MNHSQICPICAEGALLPDEKMVDFNIKGAAVQVPQHLHWCDTCGVEFATDEDTRLNARAFRSAELSAEGRLVGSDIKAIRKNLGFTQEIAGKVFGGGPVAFCKYEKDDLSPSEPMDNLLWIIQKYPHIAYELAERHCVPLKKGFAKQVPAVTSEKPSLANQSESTNPGNAFRHDASAALASAYASKAQIFSHLVPINLPRNSAFLASCKNPRIHRQGVLATYSAPPVYQVGNIVSGELMSEASEDMPYWITLTDVDELASSVAIAGFAEKVLVDEHDAWRTNKFDLYIDKSGPEHSDGSVIDELQELALNGFWQKSHHAHA